MEKKKMASPGTERDLAKTWYENSSPGGRQRLEELFANVREELKGVEQDREREEEASTDV
jgi:hypothetical protein